MNENTLTETLPSVVSEPVPLTLPVNEEFERLLEHIKSSRDFDFTGYKRVSLMRRVDKQMQAMGVSSYSDYVDYLEVHPEEFERLFDTILINVTTFFRDTESWDYLRGEVIPRILKSKKPGEPIRLWSAGCATGQEPYSLAMAMAEEIGLDRFREQVKIYATDLDEPALTQARAGVYSAREIQSVPPALREKYFEREDDTYIFQRDLRRALIFGRHDLMQDAPISRIDLLTCRNTIMYFNAEVQARIISRFHFAVSHSGFLFLGKAEMLFTHAALFAPVDLKRRVFQKIAVDGIRGRTHLLPSPASVPAESQSSLRETMFQEGPVAQIVVDIGGSLTMSNERARHLFRLTDRDLGRPLQDLELSYRPVELRSCIDRAYSERRPVAVSGTAYSPSFGETVYLDTLVTPLLEGGTSLGVGISFTDVTRIRQLSEELQAASRELEMAYEELQSTNEELETTNEELQSTNEELQTINEELRLRSFDLDQVNLFLKSILASLRGAVMVLDPELRIQFWNGQSEDFWGLRSEETLSRPLLSLDIGLPTTALVPAMHACLAQRDSRQEVAVEALNRRGKSIQCSAVLTPLVEPATGDIRGVLVQIEEAASDGSG